MDAPLIQDVELVLTPLCWHDDCVALSEAGVQIDWHGDREFVWQGGFGGENLGFVAGESRNDLANGFHQFTIGWDV
jgi:hypothetical protein